MPVAIDKKNGLGEIVSLGQLVQEYSNWIGASLSEDYNIENEP
jgi:hypothetical protein